VFARSAPSRTREPAGRREVREVPSARAGTKRLLRLLLIEDSEDHARLVLETLERGGFFPSPVRVETEPELRSALGGRGFDLVISGFGLPDFDALAALSVLEELAPDLPVIIVSGAVGEERAVAVMRAGARDFVPRGRPGRLLPAVERELAEAEQRRARARAEKALRESEVRYRSLFHGAAISLWDADVSEVVDMVQTLREEGVSDFRAHVGEHDEVLRRALEKVRVIDVNDAALRLFGARETKELFAGFEAGRKGPALAPFREVFLAIAEGRAFFEAEIEAHTLRGEGKVLWMTGRLLLGPRSAPNRLLVSLTDLTEHRRAEQALREREEQLRQAQKLEAIGRLAGGVAHDFNNLLTVIAGHTELLMFDLPSDGPWRASVQEIAECQERAASLTQQLLVFSRREVRKPKVLDLNRVVVNTERMLRRLIGEDVEIKTCLALEISPVYMDPGHLDQVLVSLALNARDAMPNGGRLSIETARAPGGDVLLEVADTGVGMDDMTAARVFEPFFTTKEFGQGMGLGLSTVYGIISQSDGTISLESEPGVGTRFRIRLPPADRLVESVELEGARTKLPRGAESILVVEDETSMRRLVQRALRRAGYRVATARDGEEALELLEVCELSIDLLLTDVVMPRMGGQELAARLRVARPDLEVVFMSGYAGHPGSDSMFCDPPPALLQKPFSLDQLCRTVRERLDTRE